MTWAEVEKYHAEGGPAIVIRELEAGDWIYRSTTMATVTSSAGGWTWLPIDVEGEATA